MSSIHRHRSKRNSVGPVARHSLGKEETVNDLWVACGQFVSEPGDRESNTARMLCYARQARDRGCRLILFPELIVTGYLPPQQVQPLAEALDGPNVATLARGAREIGIAIAFGMAEWDQERGVRYNSLVVMNDSGQLIARYNKIHLWDSEQQWAQPGSEVPLFVYAGARWSGWICYDTRFPEVARLSALRGAEICLVPTAWLGPGREWELALPNTQELKDRFKNEQIEDILFVVTYSGHTPEWPL